MEPDRDGDQLPTGCFDGYTSGSDADRPYEPSVARFGATFLATRGPFTVRLGHFQSLFAQRMAFS